MKASGIQFAYIKFSQGTAYRDDAAVTNTVNARANGFKVGPYHFVTNENGIDQVNWFKKCMEGMTFDLPPALDCEAYAANPGPRGLKDEVVTLTKFQEYLQNNMYTGLPLSFEYPSEAVVDVMAMRLMNFQNFPMPAIYTNVSGGNYIFHSPKMAQYLLWLAAWGTNKPNKPKVWANQPIFIHQYEVSDGIIHGLTSGKIDHDVWMDKYPFPGEPTVTPAKWKISITIDDITYSGELV